MNLPYPIYRKYIKSNASVQKTNRGVFIVYKPLPDLVIKTVGIVFLPVPAVSAHLLDVSFCLPAEELLGL